MERIQTEERVRNNFGISKVEAEKIGTKVTKDFASEKIGKAITGYTRHGLNQAISRDGGKGVSPAFILDAVRNPIKIIEQTGGTLKYVGQKATVILNKAGEIITIYGEPR